MKCEVWHTTPNEVYDFFIPVSHQELVVKQVSYEKTIQVVLVKSLSVSTNNKFENISKPKVFPLKTTFIRARDI